MENMVPVSLLSPVCTLLYIVAVCAQFPSAKRCLVLVDGSGASVTLQGLIERLVSSISQHVVNRPPCEQLDRGMGLGR